MLKLAAKLTKKGKRIAAVAAAEAAEVAVGGAPADEEHAQWGKADFVELGDLVCEPQLLSTSTASDKRMYRRYLHAASTHDKKRDKAVALARQAKAGLFKELTVGSKRSIASVFGSGSEVELPSTFRFNVDELALVSTSAGAAASSSPKRAEAAAATDNVIFPFHVHL